MNRNQPVSAIILHANMDSIIVFFFTIVRMYLEVMWAQIIVSGIWHFRSSCHSWYDKVERRFWNAITLAYFAKYICFWATFRVVKLWPGIFHLKINKSTIHQRNHQVNITFVELEKCCVWNRVLVFSYSWSHKRADILGTIRSCSQIQYCQTLPWSLTIKTVQS